MIARKIPKGSTSLVGDQDALPIWCPQRLSNNFEEKYWLQQCNKSYQQKLTGANFRVHTGGWKGLGRRWFHPPPPTGTCFVKYKCLKLIISYRIWNLETPFQQFTKQTFLLFPFKKKCPLYPSWNDLSLTLGGTLYAHSPTNVLHFISLIMFVCGYIIFVPVTCNNRVCKGFLYLLKCRFNEPPRRFKYRTQYVWMVCGGLHRNTLIICTIW